MKIRQGTAGKVPGASASQTSLVEWHMSCYVILTRLLGAARLDFLLFYIYIVLHYMILH